MSKRQPDRRPRPGKAPNAEPWTRTVPDLHLWREVADTIAPLRPGRQRPLMRMADDTLPLPPVSPHRPKRPQSLAPMPSYQSDGRPGRPPGHGIEPGMRKRLQRGTLEIDGTLDLHGMRQVEAHAALTRFIHSRVSRGDRTILVITGKGLKKLERDAATIVEAGVLRTMLPIWLSEPGLAPLIAGWDAAAQHHGGEGAFYVRLRSAAR
jgi:DNA-nicking Smr family endonuclease